MLYKTDVIGLKPSVCVRVGPDPWAELQVAALGRTWSSARGSHPALPKTSGLNQFANPGKSINWLLLGISIPLSLTSCPLRTVH